MDWRQRPKKLWMREEDANQRFFHLMTNGRTRANQILRVQVEGMELYRASKPLLILRAREPKPVEGDW